MKKAIGLMFLVASSAFGAADYTAIKDILGQYSVIDWDTSFTATGKVTIFADDTGVGFRGVPTKLASDPIPAFTLTTPKEQTVLTRENNLIVQEYERPGLKVRVEYVIYDGYLEINANHCDTGCNWTIVTVTTGKVPSITVNAKDFLQNLKGTYAIEKAGAEKPKPSNNTADVDIEGDPTEAALYVPYCLPSGVCDAGYIPFNYETTKVYQRTVTPGHEVYVLLIGSGPRVTHYSWEDNRGLITFRNFQYQIDGTPVVMEHVMRKIP